jgi:acylphosphatase
MRDGRASRVRLAFRFSLDGSRIMQLDPSAFGPAAGWASVEVRLAGRVQGVGFRYFALELARRLGVAGYVMNTRDGGVRAYAEGPREALEQFLRSLQQGPGGARVREVRTTWGAASGTYSTFSIQPTL